MQRNTDDRRGFWRLGRGIGSRPVLAVALALGLAAPAMGQNAVRFGAGGVVPSDGGIGAVVLELYTAQGCSACPPADAMLAGLADRDDVIALALHVDYWDYIGWADVFADPEHAERQKRYARRNGMNTIYTPQVVINGQDILEGFRVMAIMDAIEAHRMVPPTARLTLTRDAAGLLAVRGEPVAMPPPMVASRAFGPGVAALAGALAAPPDEALHLVQLVRYTPLAQVEITAGENAGLTADYLNIVTSWQTIGTWDLRHALVLDIPVQGDEPVVVLVQEPGQGNIVVAARLH